MSRYPHVKLTSSTRHPNAIRTSPYPQFILTSSARHAIHTCVFVRWGQRRECVVILRVQTCNGTFLHYKSIEYTDIDSKTQPSLESRKCSHINKAAESRKSYSIQGNRETTQYFRGTARVSNSDASVHRRGLSKQVGVVVSVVL